jgi:hypothetical protein
VSTYLVILSNPFKSITLVREIDKDLSYEHHLSLRLSNYPTHTLLLLEILNDKKLDSETAYVIIYDKKYMRNGFHPAIILDNTAQVTLAHLQQFLSLASKDKSIMSKLISEMRLHLKPEAIMDIFKAAGMEIIYTTPKSVEEKIMRAIDEKNNPTTNTIRGE